MEKVRREDECWIWRGTLQRNGYPSFARGGKYGNNVLAHRWSYAHFVASIPEGHQIHHTCGTVACVNPDHLEAVTPKEHGRAHLSDACPKGHPRTNENTYVNRDGFRFCRPCRAAYQRSLRRKRREARLAAA